MSGFQHATTRSSLPALRKSSGLKASRSALSSKNLSIGGAKRAKKDKEEAFDPGEDEDTMAMSFLQYW